MRSTLMVALALAGLTAATPASADMALARKNGCMSCHAVNMKLVGPAYADVAKKYKGDSKAPAMLATKIQKGGKGVWGPMMMPPHPNLSNADALKLANWILGGAK